MIRVGFGITVLARSLAQGGVDGTGSHTPNCCTAHEENA